MGSGRTFAAAAVVFLALWPLAAAAQGEADIRWIDGQGASSDCIGAPDTAVCAVETALACRVRRDGSLCGAVGLGLPKVWDRPFAERTTDPFAVVEATGVKYVIRDEEEGDERRIGVSVRFHGKHGLNWPGKGWRRLVYGVRREGDIWRIERVSWQPWIRRIAPRVASSDCVGSQETPVCAVETHLACRVRGDAALCDGLDGLEPKHFRPKGATVLYFIDRIRKWAPPGSSAPGGPFVTVWVAESTDIPAPGQAPSDGAYVARPEFIAVSYLLGRRGGEWRVVNRTERP